jgi:hypothetical protein
VGKQTPEAVTNVERALDCELRQIVRQISARRHGRPLKGAAMRRRRDPAAKASRVLPCKSLQRILIRTSVLLFVASDVAYLDTSVAHGAGRSVD